MSNNKIDGFEYTEEAIWQRFKRAIQDREDVLARELYDQLNNSFCIPPHLRTLEEWQLFDDSLFRTNGVSWPEEWD